MDGHIKGILNFIHNNFNYLASLCPTNTKYLMNTYGYIEGRYGQRQNKQYSTPVLLQELNEALYTDEKADFNKKEMEFLRVCFATALQAAVEQYFR